MPDPIWYRSLYWRIALGFVALLATLLVLQIFVFLWMTGRMTDLFPSRSPAQFAATIGTEVSAELVNQPLLNIDTFANGRYSGSSRGFVIAMADGRNILSDRVPPPSSLLMTARRRLNTDRFGDRPPNRRPPPPGGFGPGGPGPGGPGRDGFGGAGQGPGPGRGGRDSFSGAGQGPGPGGFGRDSFPPPFGGRGDRSFRGDDPGSSGVEFAQVIVNGAVEGIVAVPREPPPLSVAMRNLGPVLAPVALGLLVTGTAIGALVIFRPARRRLRELQEAAHAIGEGATGVRAPETGGDEVTSLAHAFNDMAGQLEQRTRALEDADRTRRQLLADVSHELTTPLAAVRGYVETLMMTDIALDSATRDRYLGIVNDETERLDHIVGDLLDLAKLEGGGGSLRIEEVSIAQLFQRIRHRHEPVVRDKAVTLKTMIDSDVSTASGDPNRLEQALQNLVANAVRHTPSGGTVLVSASTDDDDLVLRVQDSGSGIPAEHLDRVFDRFYKVDESRTGTAQPSGSGLGLSIVRAIVTRHGGTVTVSNVPEGGAQFEIRLRLAPTSSP